MCVIVYLDLDEDTWRDDLSDLYEDDEVSFHESRSNVFFSFGRIMPYDSVSKIASITYEIEKSGEEKILSIGRHFIHKRKQKN